MPFVICGMLQKNKNHLPFTLFYFFFILHIISFCPIIFLGSYCLLLFFKCVYFPALMLDAVVDLAVVTFVFILFVSSILIRFVGGKTSELLWDHYSLTCTRGETERKRE